MSTDLMMKGILSEDGAEYHKFVEIGKMLEVKSDE